MCGRYTLTADLDFLIERFDVAYPLDMNWTSSYNIAPSQPIPAVVRGERGNKLGMLKWGLVPQWADDPKIGYKMINARSETAPEKPSFRGPLRRQRCLIAADGFYEWQRLSKTSKQPYHIALENDETFAFAGLWSMWEKDGTTLATCTILTTEANELMAPLHHRMPVILAKDDEEDWLNPETDLSTLKHLMKPFDSDKMKTQPVSERVNSPKNNDETLIHPL